MTLSAGVIAVQGDVDEHVAAIERVADRRGVEARVQAVRTGGVVPECDVVAMPGGESTAISRLLTRTGIDTELRDHVDAGNPLLATCAGLIVAARDANDDRVTTLDVVDVSVDRNAFGRQVDSFEADLDVTGFDTPFPAVFIRAPVIDTVGDDVRVLATWDGRPVAVQDGPVVGTAFHPELTGDSRIHELAFFERDAPTV